LQAHYSIGMLLASQGRVGDDVGALRAAVKATRTIRSSEVSIDEALRRNGSTAESLVTIRTIKADPKQLK